MNRAGRKQRRGAEMELAQGLAKSDFMDGTATSPASCPSQAVLQRFVAGECNSTEALAMLDHLGSCYRCIHDIENMRFGRKVVKGALFALAATAAVFLAFWLAQKYPSSDTASVATVDLRPLSPTRGTENLTVSKVSVSRRTDSLRLILSPGTEGKYDFEIRPDWQAKAVLQGTSQAVLVDQTVALSLPVSFRNLPAGHYFLGLRRNHSEWVFYSMDLE